MSSIKALIMAGGKSSRLGKEKAFIEYYGKPQILHLYQILKSLHLEVSISCNQDQTARFQNICPLIVDQRPSIGPMGGIFAAMSTYPGCDWLIVACDMPMVSLQTFQNLLNSHGEKPVTTYKSEMKAFPEVLLTIYKEELLLTFQQAMESKDFSLQTLLKSVETVFILPESELELMNVNTIDDLNRVKDLIKGK